MVAGSGIQGLILVAKPEIKTCQDLKGKKIGTVQADTLDILVCDCLKKLGLTYQDVQMQYLGDSVELTKRVLGANRRRVIQHVIFPAILPNLFVTVRINLCGAWMGVLAAEMVGVCTGMGAIVVAGRQMMNMNLTFLGMAMIGLAGYLLDASFGLIQKRVLWWRSSARL